MTGAREERAGAARAAPPATRADLAGAWAGKRILVSRLRYRGDAVLTLPLLAALRRSLPQTELHYLAEPATLEMLAAQPEIAVRWTAPRGTRATLGLVAALRRQRFAAAIDLFCNPRSALLVRASGAPVRIGEDRRVRRHAYTLARRLVPGRSAVAQHLDALAGLGLPLAPETKPMLALREPERAAGEARWRAMGLAPGVLVHLGASHPEKEWPVEPATAFVRGLAAAGWPVLLSSAPARPEPSQEVAAAAAGPGVRLLPPLAMREALGVVAAARAVVSVDGALVHSAVGLGRPTIALFGPTDAAVWFPYARFGPYRVLQAPARGGARSRLEDLAAEIVLRTLLGLLVEPAPGDREVRP